MKNWEHSWKKTKLSNFVPVCPERPNFPAEGFHCVCGQFTHVPHSPEQSSTLHCFESPGEFPPAFHENEALSISSAGSRGRSANKFRSGRSRHLRSWASVNMQQNEAGMENRGHFVPHTLRGGGLGREMLVDLRNMRVCLLWPRVKGRQDSDNIWSSATEKRSQWSQSPTRTLDREAQNRNEMGSSARRMNRPPPLMVQ